MDKYRVYVPKSQHKFVVYKLRDIILASGGSTRWDAKGAFLSPAGVLVTESVIVYEFNDNDEVVPKIHSLVEELKRLGEASVLVETFKVSVWSDSDE